MKKKKKKPAKKQSPMPMKPMHDPHDYPKANRKGFPA